MSQLNARRQFLQASLAAGAGLGIASNPLHVAGVPTHPQQDEPGGRRLAPGRVAWRRDFAAACAAAQRSAKPVLHFHMLGRLDQELC